MRSIQPASSIQDSQHRDVRLQDQPQADLRARLEEVEVIHLKLSNRVIHTLARAGVMTIGDLLPLTRRDLFLIQGLANHSVDQIQQSLRQALNTPTEYLQAASSRELAGALAREPRETWAEIVEPFLRSEKQSHIGIFLSRYGIHTRTLAELAAEIGVTRERVRQIGERVAQKLARHTAAVDAIQLLERVITLFGEQHKDLSLASFRAGLIERGLLGAFSSQGPDPFDLLIGWLHVLSNSRLTTPPLDLPVTIDELRQRP